MTSCSRRRVFRKGGVRPPTYLIVDYVDVHTVRLGVERICRALTEHQSEAFVSHPNATLTRRTSLRLARLIVDDNWNYAAAAKMFMVAPKTANKWAERYLSEGPAGKADRSSRPRTSPASIHI